MAEGLRRHGVSRAALCLSLVCMVAGTPRLSAQQVSTTQSKNKVPIFHVFEPSKNETVTSVGLLDPGTRTELAIWVASTSSTAAASTHLPMRFTLSKAYYVYPGKTPARPQSVGFEFLGGKEEEKHADGLDFSVSVEGQQIYQGKTAYGRSFFPAGYITTHTAAVPTELFLRVAQGRKARFQIGRKSYDLNDRHLKQLRALMENIEVLGK